jgi:hypothetical protein
MKKNTSTVNQGVLGSSPRQGAKREKRPTKELLVGLIFLFRNGNRKSAAGGVNAIQIHNNFISIKIFIGS